MVTFSFPDDGQKAFDEALDDLTQGKVVDLDTALNEPFRAE